MSRIFEIDPNFRVETSSGHEDAVFFDPRKEPFKIYGVFYENGMFRRLPEAVAERVGEGVKYLHANTAGGRLRFRTDSPYIIINAKMSGVEHFPHFPISGSGGFDLYVDGVYARSFMPPADMKDGFESSAEPGETGMRDVLIHFPLYSNVNSLAVGLKAGSAVLPGGGYRDIPPVVYYGSSITQGGCASRPGNAYENIVSRELGVDHVNLGFSGSAKGEDEITEYIAGLDMSAFVLDYDHNAPTAGHLKSTHEKMFLAIREKHPVIPVIMMSRPKYILTEDEKRRRGVVLSTYERAVAAGDEHVFFLDGPALMARAKNDGTVDDCHPNDLGFFSMAQALTPVLGPVL
ncbi:MAG: SGNH/GDSL hydrolase family protein [Clostridia bacterium]|nr:SGNH/GDSL hydrolase family protein [Clostridia bacterium]